MFHVKLITTVLYMGSTMQRRTLAWSPALRGITNPKDFSAPAFKG